MRYSVLYLIKAGACSMRGTPSSFEKICSQQTFRPVTGGKATHVSNIQHNPFSVLVSQKKPWQWWWAACSQRIYHNRRGTAVINKNKCIPLRWATSRLLIFFIPAPCNDLVVHFMEAINTMSFTCAFPAHDKSLSVHENVYIRTQKCKPQKKVQASLALQKSL